MSGLQYYIVDCETNGIKQNYHEINEISLIRCSDRMQMTLFIKCQYPERSSFDALQVCKKTLADLDKGISKEEAITKIDRFLNQDGLTSAHRCIIGHNVSFDRRFVCAMYESVKKTFECDLYLCTMALTRAYAKQMGIIKPKVNLQASCDLVGIKKIAAAHASKVDSRNTYLLWQNLVEEKKVDYLPLIKTAQHTLKTNSSNDEEEGLDPSLLDL
jgi:DNA polymerase III epsilon subunit-like protein